MLMTFSKVRIVYTKGMGGCLKAAMKGRGDEKGVVQG